MSRTLNLAVVQMDAAPAPVLQRLERAADLIAEAAGSGAQIIVLPEVFNTGYEYADANYALAEPIDGQTVIWMKAQAAQHKVHLVGSLMLLDAEDVYNAALLVAPDGRLWRYDKQYPFLWERAYFREGDRITIADTDLGKIGLMICWDSAHNELWQRYAGKVDALLIASCPPDLGHANLVFPDGTRVNLSELGQTWEQMAALPENFSGSDIDRHAAWMGVPVVHSQGSGKFRSTLPRPLLSMCGYLASRNDLWGHLLHADKVVIESGYDQQAKIVDAAGKVAARVKKEGDGYALAEVTLGDVPPKPVGSRPVMGTPKPLYLLADIFGPALLANDYRRKLRRQWGGRMAPVDTATKVWSGITFGALALGWLMGVARRDNKPRRKPGRKK